MGKILVVDDEKGITEMVAKFLESMGHEAITAQSGSEAIEKVTQEEPQIVLLDIRMPGMDGIETLKKIKALDPKIGVVMITAVSDEVTAKECMDLGAFDYITKPISLDYLERVVVLKLLKMISDGGA